MQRGHRAISLRVGFTLIELAMVLVIASLAVGFGIQATQSNSSRNCYAQTQSQLNDINKALIRFVTTNDRFPVPAGYNLGVADPAYGKEVPVNGTTHLASTTNIWDSNHIYYGALPFQALGLPNTYAADCWGNKFTYVVSDNLTYTGFDDTGVNSTTPEKALGFNDVNPADAHPITIRTGTLATGHNTLVDGNAAYAVISHGADGSGAFARNFTGSLTNCNNSTSTHIDIANCKTNGVVYTSPFNNGSVAAQFFDDLVIYGDKPPIAPCAGNMPVYWPDKVAGPCKLLTPYPHTASLPTLDTSTQARVGNLQSPGTVEFNIITTYSTITGSNVATYGAGSSTSSGTVVCNNGVPSVVAPSSCMKNCDATTAATWTESVYNAAAGTNVTNTCTGTVTPMQDDSNGTLTPESPIYNTNNLYSTATTTSNSYGPGSGSSFASFVCNNGSWQGTGTCRLNCAANATVKWGTGNVCQATVSSAGQDGLSVNGLNNTTSGYMGTTTATCINGTWTTSGGSCTPVCNGTVTWGPGNACSATVSNLPANSSQQVSYAGSNATGSTTATCGAAGGLPTASGGFCDVNTSQSSFTPTPPPTTGTAPGGGGTGSCAVVQTAYGYGDSTVSQLSPGVWKFGAITSYHGVCATYDRYYYIYIPDITTVTQASLNFVDFDDFEQISVNGVQAFNGPFGGDTLQVVTNPAYSQCFTGFSNYNSNTSYCAEGSPAGGGCQYACSSGTPDIDQETSGSTMTTGNWVQYLSNNATHAYPSPSASTLGGCELDTNWVTDTNAKTLTTNTPGSGVIPFTPPSILSSLHSGVNIIHARTIASGDGRNFFIIQMNTSDSCTTASPCSISGVTIANGATIDTLINAACGSWSSGTYSDSFGGPNNSTFEHEMCENGTLKDVADYPSCTTNCSVTTTYTPASTSPGGYPLSGGGTLTHGICTCLSGNGGNFCCRADYGNDPGQSNYGSWSSNCPVPYESDGFTPIHD